MRRHVRRAPCRRRACADRSDCQAWWSPLFAGTAAGFPSPARRAWGGVRGGGVCLERSRWARRRCAPPWPTLRLLRVFDFWKFLLDQRAAAHVELGEIRLDACARRRAVEPLHLFAAVAIER